MSRFAVVGGGISGLTAAYELEKLGADVVLFEAGSRLGGALQTVELDGCLLECGPDSLLRTKPSAIRLAEELGIELIPCSAKGSPGVVHRGSIQPLPDGFRLLAPTKLLPFVKTPLLTPMGKARAGMEWLIPATKREGDESVESFVVRRFGREVLEALAQPLIGGIYAADPARLSVLATLPTFRQLEQEQGSVTAGLLGQIKKFGKSKKGLFVTPRLGMGSLVDALSSRVAQVRKQCEVDSVRPLSGRWELAIGGKAELFEGVILACSARHLPALTAFDTELSRSLGQIPTTTTVTLNLVFRRNQIGAPLTGSGFVVPHREGLKLTACTFSHLKYEGRAPRDKALLRCHFGNALEQEVVSRSEEALFESAMSELRPLLGIEGDPTAHLLVRHKDVLPQYRVGHLKLVERLEEQLLRYKGLALAGNALNGVGISACIEQAKRVVRELATAVPICCPTR